MADLPPDPITALAAGAAGLHESFVAFQRAGFKREEALYLVGQIVAASAAAGVARKGTT